MRALLHSRCGIRRQTYRRDMGGGVFALMKDVSAPIMVGGRHRGGLRPGQPRDDRQASPRKRRWRRPSPASGRYRRGR
ncbi:MAG: hypothetical protein EA385_11190 [Salinarimonadaceae bacterium]|nr:MAG: hypothetical protein EA385_11190 [Salinarimonadaceae bacterium]